MATRSMRWSWWIGGLLACGALAARGQEPARPDPFPPAAPGEVGLPAGSLDALAAAVAGLVERDELVGAELLVIKDDRTVLHRAFGWKDREERVAMELDTIFCIRSMTKPVAGTAAQIEIEEKRLALADPVAKHISSFDSDTRRGITVEHLLRHTSGLRLSSLITNDMTALTRLRDAADFAAEGELLFAPGARWSYSDDGADVLGALIEHTAAMPFDHVVRERILEPLGMRDTLTFVGADHERRAQVASNYAGSRGAWARYWKPGDKSLFPILLASQGLYSTPRDYARFLALWKERGRFQGVRLMKPSTVARALTPANPASFPTGFDGAETRYGELWVVWTELGDAGERETLAFGHGGSDGTLAYVFPALDLMVLLFSQSRNNHTFVEFERALERHVLHPLRGRTGAPAITYTADELAAIVGIYWEEDDGEALALLHEEGGLVAEFPGKAQLALKATATRDRFDLVLSRDSYLVVERDSEGRVAAVVGHNRKGSERHPRLTPADDLPSADDVLALRERTLERVRALGPLRFTGTYELSARGASGETSVVCDGFERLRSEMSGALTGRLALDGDEGWSEYGGSGTTVENAAGVERLRFDHVLFAVADWRPVFVDLRVLARVERSGAALLLLRGTTRHGNARYLVVDATTGRLLEERRIEPDMGAGEIGAVVTYADWRAFEGVELPMHVTYRFASSLVGNFDVRYERVERAGELAPGTFRLAAR